MADAITAQQVADWLKWPADDGSIAAVVPAVNSFVAGLPATWKPPAVVGEPPTDWTDQAIMGAKMLAARLARRRNSPGGIEAITESGASFVARHDSDISRLLKLDGFAAPMVG